MRGHGSGVTVAVLVLGGLVAGACAGSGSSSGSSSAEGHDHVVATFAAVDASASASTSQLTDDAREVNARLHALGDAGASVTVRRRSVVVSGGPRLPIPASALLAPGTLQLRPALCQADRYTPPAPGGAVGTLPTTCSLDRYSLLAPNLTVDTAGVSNASAIGPDPALSSYPSTTAADNDADPDGTVLVPANGDGGLRYLLGPTAVDDTAVASARAAFVNPDWIVNVTLTSAGTSAWDALARRSFHEFIGIDVDGQAVSVPIVQPGQPVFSPFGGRFQIASNFTRQSAEALAAVLDSGPLTTPLAP
jgi:hypothetical protein